MQRDTVSFLEKIGVASYLVERLRLMRPPRDNIYWEGREHYIDPNVRYLSIPILFDLFLKADLTTVDTIFKTLPVLEAELEISEHEERGDVTFSSALRGTMNLPLVAAEHKRRSNLRRWMRYYIATTPIHSSLRRGNFIIPYFSLLNTNDGAVRRMCQLATNVITCGCVLDDLKDYRSDKDSGEPNILAELETCLRAQAIREVTAIYRAAVAAIAGYNPQIEVFLLSAFCNLSLRWRFAH